MSKMAIDLPSMNKVVRDDSAAAALTKMMRYNYGPHLNRPLAEGRCRADQSTHHMTMIICCQTQAWYC